MQGQHYEENKYRNVVYSVTIISRTNSQVSYKKGNLIFPSLAFVESYYSATNSTGATQGFLTNQKPIC